MYILSTPHSGNKYWFSDILKGQQRKNERGYRLKPKLFRSWSKPLRVLSNLANQSYFGVDRNPCERVLSNLSYLGSSAISSFSDSSRIWWMWSVKTYDFFTAFGIYRFLYKFYNFFLSISWDRDIRWNSQRFRSTPK